MVQKLDRHNQLWLKCFLQHYPNLLDGTESLTDETTDAAETQTDATDNESKIVVCTDERAAALWSRIVSKLGKRINASALATWFGEGAITPIKLENQQLTIHAANQVVRDWVGDNYANHLEAAVSETAEKNQKIELLWQVAEG